MKSKSRKGKPDLKNLSPHIVIRFKNYPLPYTEEDEIKDYLIKNNVIPWKQLVDQFPCITIRKLFTALSPGDIIKLVSDTKGHNHKYIPPNFLACFAIDCPFEVDIDKLLKMLLSYKNVEDAYIESDLLPPAGNMTGTNPDADNQGYLNPAPEGIDAKHAWNVNGGRGDGRVKFIDIELGWILNHEDIIDSGVNLLWGNDDPTWESHGAAVLGIILMQDNDKGGVGITPKIKANVIAHKSRTGHNVINDAILKAIDSLDAGDVLLLEAQFTERDAPHKHWPVEVKSMTFDVIKLATTKGIIVIEPAGNGSLDENLGNDLDEYTDRDGKKILDITSPDFKDSGAIIVAAASASNTHRRRPSSNFGNRIDCFAWGTGVYTAGDSTTTYEPDFNGTSSASAIIAGVAIAVQSTVEASGNPRLTPEQMRDILRNRSNGTSSTSRRRIGVMPDLKKII